MTSFTYFSTVSDVNVILSEGLFLHVSAQIYILSHVQVWWGDCSGEKYSVCLL